MAVRAVGCCSCCEISCLVTFVVVVVAADLLVFGLRAPKSGAVKRAGSARRSGRPGKRALRRPEAAPPWWGRGRSGPPGFLASLRGCAQVERQSARALRDLARGARRGERQNLQAALAVGQPPAALGQLHLERLRGAGGDRVPGAAEPQDGLQSGELDA